MRELMKEGGAEDEATDQIDEAEDSTSSAADADE
jgi:hypothetical protein